MVTERTYVSQRSTGAMPLTVLIVDDDHGVRNAVIDIVAAMGFRVFAADSGVEAMRILVQQHIDVLFADIVMPDKTGIELAREAKKLRPDLQVMLSTGYYSRAKEASDLGRLLYKPMRAHEIEAALDGILHPRGGVPRR